MNITDLKAAASKDAKTVVAAACMGAAMPDRLVEATCKGVDLDAAHDLKVTRISSSLRSGTNTVPATTPR